MPSVFRIALGRASCRTSTSNPTLTAICRHLLSELERLKAIQIEKLRQLPEEKHEEQDVGGVSASYTTYRANLPDGRLLIVMQAFIRTLAWPTYISFAGVGRMYAEGFVVDQDGKIIDAPDHLLWEYR
jgi:hypothetical protein